MNQSPCRLTYKALIPLGMISFLTVAAACQASQLKAINDHSIYQVSGQQSIQSQPDAKLLEQLYFHNSF